MPPASGRARVAALNLKLPLAVVCHSHLGFWFNETMPAVEVDLTAEQLARAYTQLSRQERWAFLEAVLTEPAEQKLALELLTEIKTILNRRFPPAKQRLLDRLLDANTERALSQSEREQLNRLIEEYGSDPIEKARARYLLKLSRQTNRASR